MNLDTFIKDFNALKRRSWEISVENRKLVNVGSKALEANRKPKVYQLEAVDEPVSSLSPNDMQKDQLMNYTIQQYEEWYARQIEKNHRNDGSNMQDLAKYTYEKELKKLHKDIKVPKSSFHGIHKVDKNSKTGKLVIKDDNQLIQKLATDMDKTATERYEARRKDLQKSDMQSASKIGGYINEKNKHYNEKLDREMPKSP